MSLGEWRGLMVTISGCHSRLKRNFCVDGSTNYFYAVGGALSLTPYMDLASCYESTKRRKNKSIQPRKTDLSLKSILYIFISVQ